MGKLNVCRCLVTWDFFVFSGNRLQINILTDILPPLFHNKGQISSSKSVHHSADNRRLGRHNNHYWVAKYRRVCLRFVGLSAPGHLLTVCVEAWFTFCPTWALCRAPSAALIHPFVKAIDYFKRDRNRHGLWHILEIHSDGLRVGVRVAALSFHNKSQTLYWWEISSGNLFFFFLALF